MMCCCHLRKCPHVDDCPFPVSVSRGRVRPPCQFYACHQPGVLLSSAQVPANVTSVSDVFPLTRPVSGTRVCVTLIATDWAGNTASVASNGSVYSEDDPIGGTITFGRSLSELRATYRRVWTRPMGVNASYAGVAVNPAQVSIDTLEWSVFQCPVTYWVFGYLDAAHHLVSLNASCAVLQPWTPLPPTPNGTLVNDSIQLTDNRTLVLAMRGTVTICPPTAIPATVSDAVLVNVNDTGGVSRAWVGVGLLPGGSTSVVDCRVHRAVEAAWGAIDGAPEGVFGYYWALAPGSFFPTSLADSAAGRTTLAWSYVGLAQVCRGCVTNQHRSHTLLRCRWERRGTSDERIREGEKFTARQKRSGAESLGL